MQVQTSLGLTCYFHNKNKKEKKLTIQQITVNLWGLIFFKKTA